MTLGQRQGDDVVVTEGVAANERVVLTGQMLVRPGGRCASIPSAPAAAPPSKAGKPGRQRQTGGQLVNLSELFIRRPVMTVVLTVSVILFGVLAYLRLPVSDLPAVDYPVIQVQVNYPGATPETMANNVATPLERQFMQIPGLELVTSNSGQGHTSFVLQFDLSKSLDAAATDVQAAITRAQGQLPVDLPSPPTFTKTNPNDQPIMYIALVSDTVTEGQLYDYANTQVGERISILPGVSQVAVYGTQSAVRIKADPSAMAIRNITLDDLTSAIKNGTSYTGAGQFDGPHRSFLLQPQGQLSTADAVRPADRRPKQRRAGLPEGCRDRQRERAGRTHRHALLGARIPAARRDRGRRRVSPGRIECGGSGQVGARSASQRFRRSFPARFCCRADLRSLADHREQHQRRAGRRSTSRSCWW